MIHIILFEFNESLLLMQTKRKQIYRYRRNTAGGVYDKCTPTFFQYPRSREKR